jgi:DNA-binding response OmpR family regulator
MMPRILVVDDEPEIVRGLEDNLRYEGYQTFSATDGEQALALAAREAPDLIVLDLMMPRLSGWDVCRALRARGIDVPIIMLTARGEEADRVRGLELGADDYIAKPFSLRELLARVRAVLRRPGPRQKVEEFAFGDVRIRLRGRQVWKAGEEIALTRKEFDLLVYLLAHRGEVVTRERLLDEVWGYERFPTTRTVDTHVLRLRRKFEMDPDRPTWILTVHGQGYRFLSPEGASTAPSGAAPGKDGAGGAGARSG